MSSMSHELLLPHTSRCLGSSIALIFYITCLSAQAPDCVKVE